MTMKTQYALIPNTTGYRAGTDGSLWTRWYRSGHPNWSLGDQWVKLKPIEGGGGARGKFLYVTIRYRGKRKAIPVGRLILESFVGQCPLGFECCHKNDDHTNNSLENLRWGTHKSNMEDRDKNGSTYHGVRHHNSKVNEVVVKEIRAARASGVVLREIATKYKLDISTVDEIAKKQTWKRVL